MTPENDYVVLTGRSNPLLAREIGKLLDKPVFEPVSSFADSETRVMIPESLRRRSVVIIQPTSPPANEYIMELLLMMDAAKRASAGEITTVIPYFGYSRQDRKDLPRVPISSAVVAKMIETMGADRIVTVDIHTNQQQGFFNGPWDNLSVTNELIQPVEALKLENLVIATTDHGGVDRARKYARRLSAGGLAIVHKERDYNANNKSRAVDITGDVEGKNVLVVDDMVDTGGSLISATELLVKRGARQIFVTAVHGLFTADALQRIKDSPIDRLFATDTIVQTPEVLKEPKITIVSIAPFLAEAIRRVQSGNSLSLDMV